MAAKHLVVCVQCGRQFDANRGGYYNSSTRRYTCKDCGRRMTSQPSAARPAAPQPVTAKSLLSPMIGKIAIGAIIAIVGIIILFMGGWFFTIFMLPGAAVFVLWGVLPYVKQKKKEDEMKAAILKAQEEIRNRQKTCPKCGAITKGHICEYCGAPLEG